MWSCGCLNCSYYKHGVSSNATNPVPLVSLVGKHAFVSIQHIIYHLISGRAVETIAEPIDCHLSRAHGIKHEILQVLQCLGIGESGFVHVYTIHDLGCCAILCATLSTGRARLESDNKRHHIMFQSTHHNLHQF